MLYGYADDGSKVYNHIVIFKRLTSAANAALTLSGTLRRKGIWNSKGHFSIRIETGFYLHGESMPTDEKIPCCSLSARANLNSSGSVSSDSTIRF